MGRVIMVASGKGGVGKTTVCASLGLTLAAMDKRVCLVDLDLGLKNLDVVLGLENRVLYDLKDFVEKRCPLEKVLLRDKRMDNLYLLPACKTVNINSFPNEAFRLVIEELSKSFDFIFLDVAAGLESSFREAMKVSDEVLLVIQLDVTSVQDADRAVGILLKENMDNIKVVVNRMNPRYIEKGISLKLKDAMEWLSLDLLGIVYEDEWMIAGNNKGKPRVLDEENLTKVCYHAMALRLLGEMVPLPRYPAKSLLRRILG